MSKQKEIREGIYRLLIEQDCENEFQRFDWERKMPAKILDYLHSQGVVIKGCSLGGSHPHLADYYTIESLIEEK